jgi:hypothetical protein
VLDCPVAKPILNGPRIVTGIGERKAAGMPEHVEMDRKA